MAYYKVFIWSEFPPKTKTGISLINQLVLDVLKKNNISVIIKEEFAWNKKTFKTILHHISNYFSVSYILIKHKIKYLYFTFTLSQGGILKMLIILPFIKLFSFKTKLIGHIHRGDFEEFAQKSLINKLLLKYYFLFLNTVIVLSENTKNSVKNFSPKSDIFVLPNTSPLENKAKKTKNYERRFICIANYIRSKGLLELVNSFNTEKLKKCQLTIYGQVYDNKFYNELKKNIKQNNILIADTIQRNKLATELIKHDCLIVPSWNEGQPIVILEAISLKIPVIASKVGDIPYMLGKNYPFYVKPKSIDDLTNKIITFDNYPDKVQLTNSLYKRYIENFSNQIFTKNVLQLFK